MPEFAQMSLRHDWSREEIAAIYNTPLNDLLYRAQGVHRAVFDPNRVQISTLLSIKTGGCSEDCKYCSQSVRYHTDVWNVRARPRRPVRPAFAWAAPGGDRRIGT